MSRVVLAKLRLSDAELDRIMKLRGQGKNPKQILQVINRSWYHRKVQPVSQTSLYDCLKGETYNRSGEARGRPTVLRGRSGMSQ